jgi:hypothetical protein
MAFALPSLIIGLIFFSLSLKLELLASGAPGRKLEAYRQSFYMHLVKIDGVYYDSDIIQAIADENKSIAKSLTEVKAELKREVDNIFNGYNANVDEYLDSYYSLKSEYARLAFLVIGELEQYMAFRLGEELSENVDTSGVDKILGRLNAIVSSVDLNKLKEKYRYNGPVTTKPLLVFDSKSIGSSIGPSPIFLPKSLRMGVAALASLPAALAANRLIKKLEAKIVSKLIFKTAVKAVLKGAAARAAGYTVSTAAGAAAGAAVGSVVPGPGTGLGIVVGGLVGLGSAILADKLLLELEEVISRDDFRAELLNSIEEQRIQAHNMIDSY